MESLTVAGMGVALEYPFSPSPEDGFWHVTAGCHSRVINFGKMSDAKECCLAADASTGALWAMMCFTFHGEIDNFASRANCQRGGKHGTDGYLTPQKLVARENIQRMGALATSWDSPPSPRVYFLATVA